MRLLIAAAVVLVLVVTSAVVADAVVRGRLQDALAASTADRDVTVGLSDNPVLWNALMGTVILEAHVPEQVVDDALANGDGGGMGASVDGLELADGLILASLGGRASTLLGGDVVVELAARAADGAIELSVVGVLVNGVERPGDALAEMFGTKTIEPSALMSCAEATGDDVGSIDDVRIETGEMVVTVTVPLDAARSAAAC